MTTKLDPCPFCDKVLDTGQRVYEDTPEMRRLLADMTAPAAPPPSSVPPGKEQP